MSPTRQLLNVLKLICVGKGVVVCVSFIGISMVPDLCVIFNLSVILNVCVIFDFSVISVFKLTRTMIPTVSPVDVQYLKVSFNLASLNDQNADEG